MKRTDRERHLTLRFQTRHGTVDLPSVLIRDDDYSDFNRVEVRGDRQTYLSSIGIQWAQSNISAVRGHLDHGNKLCLQATLLSGSASLSGVSITDDTVYTISNLRISNLTEEFRSEDDKNAEELAHLSIWPTPPAFPRPYMHYDGKGRQRRIPSRDSRWHRLSNGLQFSLTSDEWSNRVESPGFGTHKYWVGSVQFRRHDFTGDFDEACAKAWRVLHPVLTFYYRTDLRLIARTSVGLGATVSRRWPHPLRSSELDDDRWHYWSRAPGTFGAMAERMAEKWSIDPSDLHALIHNYVSGRSTDLTLEAQLVTFIEGIERAVQISETAKKLSRSTLESSKHKVFRKSLKETLSTSPNLWHGLTSKEKSAITGHLNINPNLTLLERVQRMLRPYLRWWHDHEKRMLAHMDETIRMRNSIVHGRMITNYEGLVREKQRAKLLLEKIILCLLGSPSLETSFEESMFVNGDYTGETQSNHNY